jgi:hypothetical protein
MMNQLTSVDQVHTAALERLGKDPNLPLDDLLSTITPFLEEHFANRKPDNPLKAKWSHRKFGHLGLQVNRSPVLGIIDHNLRPLVEPRLELHLNDGNGLQATKKQLGRIARFINVSEFADAYPIMTATTYAPLSKLAGRVVGMDMALATYVPPDNNEAQQLMNGISNEHSEFLRRHGKQAEFIVDSLTVPTTDFVDRWMRS